LTLKRILVDPEFACYIFILFVNLTSIIIIKRVDIVVVVVVFLGIAMTLALLYCLLQCLIRYLNNC
jgi:hypothetical protein